MKTIIILLVATFATFATFAQKSKANFPASKSDSALHVVYRCEMHPDVVSNEAGKCPKCNMDLSLSKKEQMKLNMGKTYTCAMHPEVVSSRTGFCAKCSSKLVIDRRGSKQAATVYTCSMHADVVSKNGGKCPKCGMEMTEVKSKARSKKGW